MKVIGLAILCFATGVAFGAMTPAPKRINVNHTTKAELMTVPGMSPDLAARILLDEYDSESHLKEVVGARVYEKITPYVYVPKAQIYDEGDGGGYYKPTPQESAFWPLAEALRNAPDDPVVQRAYVNGFPKTYKDFVRTFGNTGGFGHESLQELLRLSGRYETQVGNILISLSRDAKAPAGAAEALQVVFAKYGQQHTGAFGDLLVALTKADRTKVISFLTNGTDSRPLTEPIVRELNRLGKTTLAKEFDRP